MCTIFSTAWPGVYVSGEDLSLSEEMLRGDEVGPVTNRPFFLNVDAFLKAYSQADVVKKPDNPEYKDVPLVDVAQVLVDFKEKNGRDPKVYVWMGDQMKRGEYNNEESGVKVFLEGVSCSPSTLYTENTTWCGQHRRVGKQRVISKSLTS